MAGGRVNCISNTNSKRGDGGRKPSAPAAFTTAIPERGRIAYLTPIIATITAGFTADPRSPVYVYLGRSVYVSSTN